MIPWALLAFYVALTLAIMVVVSLPLPWPVTTAAILVTLVAAFETPCMTRWFMCRHGDAVRHAYTALWATA